MFIKEAEGLYRLRVPFENIATSIFLLLTPAGPVLYDCATTAADVEKVILPALGQLGIAPEQLHALVLSHAHGDHSGGLTGLTRHAPQMCVLAQAPEKYTAPVRAVQDQELLFGSIDALHLPGHTSDCLGLYDRRTHTLLSADALQWRGIGRYGCAVTYPDAYRKTIERIRCLMPDRILASHEYVPYGEKAEGAEQITRYLDSCLEALHEIEAFVIGHRDMDTKMITEAFRAQHQQWPLLPEITVACLLQCSNQAV